MNLVSQVIDQEYERIKCFNRMSLLVCHMSSLKATLFLKEEMAFLDVGSTV